MTMQPVQMGSCADVRAAHTTVTLFFQAAAYRNFAVSETTNETQTSSFNAQIRRRGT